MATEQMLNLFATSIDFNEYSEDAIQFYEDPESENEMPGGQSIATTYISLD